MKVFLFLLVFVTNIFAVNYGELFKNELKNPDKYSTTELDSLIRLNGEIHPELLHYLFDMLNGGNKEIYENARKWYGKNKNMWINGQVAIAPKEYNYLTIVNILNKYKVPDIPMFESVAEPSGKDKNRIDFYVCKYLSEDTSLQYSSDYDYSTKRKNLENKKLGKLLSILNKKITSNKTDVFEYVMRFWYILAKPENRGKFREPVKYLSAVKIYGSEDTVNRFEYAGINKLNIAFGYHHTFTEIDHETKITGSGYKYGVTIVNELKLPPGVKMFLGFKTRFLTDRGSFNNLKTTFTFFFATGKSSSSYTKPLTKYAYQVGRDEIY